MEMETIPGALDMAFRAALLLTGATKTAESAVMQGIRACGDLSHRSLVTETVRAAIRGCTKSADASDALALLPRELRRLFLLRPLLRDCFVLRFLVGLSPEVCAELLEISMAEFEDAVFAALNRLPYLATEPEQAPLAPGTTSTTV
jgi:hypothetical protein